MATAAHTLMPLAQVSRPVADWVNSVRELTRPRAVHWCEGTEAEARELTAQMLKSGELHSLNAQEFPGCHLARSAPTDVARVEHLTYICTRSQEDAGPNNHWMDPQQAHAKMRELFRGCMQGRTLYVIPYCMGPIDSPLSRCGVEITDSPYVVINMLDHDTRRTAGARAHRARRRLRAGAALHRRARSRAPLHHALSRGALDRELRLRVRRQRTPRQEVSRAAHRQLAGARRGLAGRAHADRRPENPRGETHYVACAFPSACGKTNLAMLIPPQSLPGWRVFTVGDDIAWLHPGPDGRLWAINPEAGYFGVVPGTNPETNRNAYQMIRRDTLFTNVAVTADNQPWWEGLPNGRPALDWQGRPYDPARGPAAHPNSRFTVSAQRNPSYSPHSEDARGVPISALVFGGRRREVAPLVYEARDWRHGVLVGASLASETTAAAVGQVGVTRRDPMAMQPFCGYNFGDYWQHWLNVGAKLDHPPRIYHVNWFRRDAKGKFLWPGFGENLRVLAWMLERYAGRAGAQEAAIGYLPRPEDLNLQGLDIAREDLEALLRVDPALWRKEVSEIREYLAKYGSRLPAAMLAELKNTEERLA